MKILMINLPYSGHTNPALGLAKELVRGGHEVGFINSSVWEDRVKDTGAVFIPYDDYPNHPSMNQEKRMCFKAAYDTALRVGDGYDVIIYELLFYLGDTLVKKLHKPSVRQFSMFAWDEKVLAAYINNCSFWHLLRKSYVRRKITDIASHEIQIVQRDMFEEIIYQIPSLNIVYTSREFQIYNEGFDQRFKFVGPSIYDRFQETEIPFEKMRGPIIYISLGTILNFNVLFIKRCIKAFENQNVSVIISAGKYKKHLRCKAENVYIYSSVPQLEVLKRASLFVTHGGMNSVNEAIYYGVPMLVAPMGSDQPTVANRVEELGIGKRISGVYSSASTINRLSRRVMSDSRIKENIKQQRKYMKEAGGLSKAVKLIEEFVEEQDGDLE